MSVRMDETGTLSSQMAQSTGLLNISIPLGFGKLVGWIGWVEINKVTVWFVELGMLELERVETI